MKSSDGSRSVAAASDDARRLYGGEAEAAPSSSVHRQVGDLSKTRKSSANAYSEYMEGKGPVFDSVLDHTLRSMSCNLVTNAEPVIPRVNAPGSSVLNEGLGFTIRGIKCLTGMIDSQSQSPSTWQWLDKVI